jgi:hypothetical protein
MSFDMPMPARLASGSVLLVNSMGAKCNCCALASTIDEPLRAFDVHFHLARYSIRRHGDIDLSIGELVEEKLQIPIETPVQLVGGVLVYCDVDSYPTTFPENTRWKVRHSADLRTCGTFPIKLK